MSEKKVLLELRGVKTFFPVRGGFFNKVRDHVQAVNDVDLDIYKGETLGLGGGSGCGKTTLGKSIIQLVKATDGTMMYDFGPQHGGKKDLRQLNREDEQVLHRRIQIVFQDPYSSLNPSFTIYQSLADPLRHFGVVNKTNQRALIADILEAVNMRPEYMDRYPHEFSGGQRQRVALGRAIVRDAPIFLMDEPLSNLDAKLRVSMRAEIAKLHQRLNTTTIYVTHDQTEAMTMADRVVVMSVGHVQQIGTPAEIYQNPRNQFVAGFIGSPAMNFFNMTYQDGFVSDGQSIRLKVPEGRAKILDDQGYNGKEVVFGIRPEDIHSEEAFLETWPDAVISSTVSVSELLGATEQLYLKADDTEYVANVNARDFHNPGDHVKMGFDVNKAHFFNKDTTMAIVAKPIPLEG